CARMCRADRVRRLESMGSIFLLTTSGSKLVLGSRRKSLHHLVGLGFGLALLFLTISPTAFAETAQSPIPLPSTFTPVVDNANVIDPDTRKKLESIFVNLKQRA